MVEDGILNNENVAVLPGLGRWFLLGLILRADDQGRIKGNPIYLSSIIFPYDRVEIEQIQVWLHQLVTNGSIMVYQADGKDYVQFLNWWDYQILTFAQASEYPAPEGWEDRIRSNGRFNIMLTHNWTKADGTRLEDTCDARGNPLPFVASLPPKNLGGRPRSIPQPAPTSTPQLGEDVPQSTEDNEVEVEEKVHTFPSTKVIKDQDQYKDQQKEEGESNGSALAGAYAPAPLAASELKNHVLIKAFHELHNRYPSTAQMKIIIDRGPPVADWVRAIRAWAAAGHKPVNIAGMLDWAFDLTRIDGRVGHRHHSRQAKTGYNVMPSEPRERYSI